MRKKLFLMWMPVVIMMSSSAFAAADANAGKIKYQQLCVSWDGGWGKGDGPAAVALTPKPRNFSDSKGKTDAQLAKVIKEGGAANNLSPLMPPWGAGLTDQDIANIIAYLRVLGKGGQ